jgi:hypothetical protein
MKNLPVLFVLLISASGCNFSKSAQVDLINGLTTKGDMIACDNVYITVNDQKVERTTFVYGEEFFLNFNDVKGFKRVEGKVFPGMELLVFGEAGDTVFTASDLYKGNPEGFDNPSLLLTSNLIVARPIHSGGNYKMLVKIWDKKDKGTFTATFKFKVTTNKNIVIEPAQVTYDEIYLFSKDRGKVINDNRITSNDENYLLFEGLKGFSETGGKVFPGLSMKVTESDGKEVLNEEDLFSDYSAGGLDVCDFNGRVSSSFVIPVGELKNPLHLKVLIWDKKSAAKITVSADLTYQK